jgi:hypothetical protein
MTDKVNGQIEQLGSVCFDAEAICDDTLSSGVGRKHFSKHRKTSLKKNKEKEGKVCR